MYYNYDESGISGIEYQGEQYYFIKNIQGDIIEILDSELNKIVTYEYDSWGKVISVKDDQGNVIADQDHIGNINPFRYRGYYYDEETELYYLNSRYYNPEWGRFINADELYVLVDEDNDGLLAYNLYTYAYNNPINMADSDGDIPFFVITGIAGAVVGGIIGYAKTGTVKGTLKGATIGGTIGVVGGIVGAKILTGSVTAKTSTVVAGAKTALGLGTATKSVKAISVETKSHIMQQHHLWSKVGAKNWNSVEAIIKQTLTKGTASPYKGGGATVFTYKYGKQIIEVTGKWINGIFRISDAWVKK